VTERGILRRTAAFLLLAVLAGASLAGGGTISVVRREMVPVSDDALGARAVLTQRDVVRTDDGYSFEGRTVLTFDVWDLPAGLYEVRIGKESRGSIDVAPVSTGHTHGRLVRETDLGVTGKPVTVSAADSTLFASLTASAFDGPRVGLEGRANRVRQRIPLAGPTPGGRLVLKSRRGRVALAIRADGLEPDSAWTLRVNGWVADGIEADSRGRLRLTYSIRRERWWRPRTRRHAPLTFDPSGSDYSLERLDGSGPVFTGSLGGGPVGAGLERLDSLRGPLTAVDPARGASGDVRVAGPPGARTLAVGVRDLEDGTFAIRLGSVTVGTIEVAGGRGDARFAEVPEDGSPPLAVDPLGQHLRVLSPAGAPLLGTWLPR
jgi:hypothetical protein